MRYLLGPNKTLIVRGPASVCLLDGLANVLNAPLQGKKFIVRRQRQLPIETTSEADLEITLGESATVFEVPGSTIPRSWHSALDAIVDMEQGRILVVGGTDVGKSTLTTFLTNGLLKERITCQIVDGDIGQADIGPPTCVASAIAPSFLLSLVDIHPSAMIFIGDTSPNRVQSELLSGIQRLSSLGSASLTIINTDGWISDRDAVVYKARLIEAVRPDLVLALASGNELEPIISSTSTMTMRVEAPAVILARSQVDRRQIRNSGYRRFLDGATTRVYGLRTVQLKLPTGMSSMAESGVARLRNLLVGFINDEEYLLQIGVLQNLDDNALRVYSRAVDRFATIEAGYVKLSENGTELGYLEL